ncbi:MAG: hypothetical protein JWO36_3989 [Myxococcales bacterium]|nr:hypothetical protein [Myxococcales bacterium]
MGIGGTLGVVSLALLGAALLPLATGAAGIALGAAYLMSPAWKLEVVADDSGLEVRSASKQRFRIAWAEVVRVVASPTTQTCFVNGGAPEKSLLVPGVGAPAPYDIADKPALYAAIIAHVPADKVEIVESIEKARAATTS